MSMLVRQIHRWLSMIFTVIVMVIFAALGLGQQPPQWIYFLPLLPLGLLMLSGVYLFVLPYVSRRRGADS
jgi:hypothetical protein